MNPKVFVFIPGYTKFFKKQTIFWLFEKVAKSPTFYYLPAAKSKRHPWANEKTANEKLAYLPSPVWKNPIKIIFKKYFAEKMKRVNVI